MNVWLKKNPTPTTSTTTTKQANTQTKKHCSLKAFWIAKGKQLFSLLFFTFVLLFWDLRQETVGQTVFDLFPKMVIYSHLNLVPHWFSRYSLDSRKLCMPHNTDCIQTRRSWKKIVPFMRHMTYCQFRIVSVPQLFFHSLTHGNQICQIIKLPLWKCYRY